MADAILLNNVTPEGLTEIILQGLESKLDLLRKELQPQEPDEWLTRKETGKLLKISLVCLHAWCNKGILKPYKAGNRTYFNRKEINALLFNSNK